MTAAYRWLCLTLLLGVALALACPAFGADAAKVNVLIIDGQNRHNWKATTGPIRDMLDKTGRFNVTVLTAPAAPPKNATDEQKKATQEGWDKFRPDFSKYQAVLSNYDGQPWPEEVSKAFVKYVNDGGGFVAYHFAVASFQKWDEYNQMIGMGWRNDNKFGEGLCIDDSGKEVRRPKGEGPGAGHGPAHPFECTVRDPASPITKGLPAKWPHIKDELYAGLRGPAQNMHVLVTAFSAKDKGGTGMNEPMAWTVSFGKGRVFVIVLGHDVPETTAPDAAVLLERGTEWAATGAVTIPVPADFPKAD
jgi:type 1 glutamine amidotransferase